MSFKFGFYNAIEHDRLYSAEDFGQMFDGLITDGIYSTIGNVFAVVPGSGLSVNVKSGRAWFNHTWSVNTSEYPIQLDLADLLLPRIDAIVIEIDTRVAVRANSLKKITGVPAITPAKPTLTNSDGVYQYPLAYVTVPQNAESIQAANIENCVGNVTPFVTGILKSVSISDLWNQWEAQFEEWFSTVQAQLEGNVVTNLQNQINQKVNVSDKASQSDINNGTPNKWVSSDSLKTILSTGSVEVGDLVYTTRRIDNPNYILCEGQYLDKTNYPELYTAQKVKPAIDFTVSPNDHPDDIYYSTSGYISYKYVKNENYYIWVEANNKCSIRVVYDGSSFYAYCFKKDGNINTKYSFDSENGVNFHLPFPFVFNNRMCILCSDKSNNTIKLLVDRNNNCSFSYVVSSNYYYNHVCGYYRTDSTMFIVFNGAYYLTIDTSFQITMKNFQDVGGSPITCGHKLLYPSASKTNTVRIFDLLTEQYKDIVNERLYNYLKRYFSYLIEQSNNKRFLNSMQYGSYPNASIYPIGAIIDKGNDDFEIRFISAANFYPKSQILLTYNGVQSLYTFLVYIKQLSYYVSDIYSVDKSRIANLQMNVNSIYTKDNFLPVQSLFLSNIDGNINNDLREPNTSNSNNMTVYSSGMTMLPFSYSGRFCPLFTGMNSFALGNLHLPNSFSSNTINDFYVSFVSSQSTGTMYNFTDDSSLNCILAPVHLNYDKIILPDMRNSMSWSCQKIYMRVK